MSKIRDPKDRAEMRKDPSQNRGVDRKETKSTTKSNMTETEITKIERIGKTKKTEKIEEIEGITTDLFMIN